MLNDEQKLTLKNAGYDDGKIAMYEAQKFAPQKTNYFQRIGSQYQQGAQNIMGAVQTGANTLADPNKNTLQKVGGLLETGLNTAGAVAGATFAPLTAAVEPALTPIVQKLISIPGVSQNVQKVTDWAKAHPQAAQDLQSVFDIATLGFGGEAEQLAKNVGSKVAESTGNLVDSATKVGQDVIKGTSRAGNIAGEAILGTSGQEAAIQGLKTPEMVSDFINKRATMETVAEHARQGVNTIKNKSIAQLQKVKDLAPNITIPRPTYISTFKNKMLDFLGVDSKSVGKVTDKNLGEFLNQTGFGEQEAGVIKRLSGKIANWKDTSLKGLLDLKASIAKTGFYKEGHLDYPNSNKFVQMVNNHIKDLIINEEHGGYSKLAPALKKSSDVQTYLDSVKTELGMNSGSIESTASKLNTLMTKLADPLQKEATIKLLDRFKKLTGKDLISMLNSARAAKTIEAPLAGFKNPLRTAQGLLDRGAGRLAIKLGKARK